MYYGKLLRHYRKKKKISQAKLAELVGYHASTICRYELGVRRIPTEDGVRLLAKKLRLTPEETQSLLAAYHDEPRTVLDFEEILPGERCVRDELLRGSIFENSQGVDNLFRVVNNVVAGKIGDESLAQDTVSSTKAVFVIAELLPKLNRVHDPQVLQACHVTLIKMVKQDPTVVIPLLASQVFLGDRPIYSEKLKLIPVRLVGGEIITTPRSESGPYDHQKIVLAQTPRRVLVSSPLAEILEKAGKCVFVLTKRTTWLTVGRAATTIPRPVWVSSPLAEIAEKSGEPLFPTRRENSSLTLTVGRAATTIPRGLETGPEKVSENSSEYPRVCLPEHDLLIDWAFRERIKQGVRLAFSSKGGHVLNFQTRPEALVLLRSHFLVRDTARGGREAGCGILKLEPNGRITQITIFCFNPDLLKKFLKKSSDSVQKYDCRGEPEEIQGHWIKGWEIFYDSRPSLTYEFSEFRPKEGPIIFTFYKPVLCHSPEPQPLGRAWIDALNKLRLDP